MRSTPLAAISFCLVASVALAKDDTPDARGFSKSSPWHPFTKSRTNLSQKCGAEISTFHLLRDDRDWMELSGQDRYLWTPVGRFVNRGDGWKRITDDAWDAVRLSGRSLRELFGAPLVPDTWTIAKHTHEGTAVHFTLEDGKTELVYDTLAQTWRAQRPGWRVTELTQFDGRKLPTKVVFDDGCTLRRGYEVPRGETKLPTRDELPL